MAKVGLFGGDKVTAEETLAAARIRFLQDLQLILPEVLQSLHDNVLPDYSKAHKAANNLNIGYLKSWDLVSSLSPYKPFLVPLATSLNNWASSFHLEPEHFKQQPHSSSSDFLKELHRVQPLLRPDWVLNTALRTLAAWHRDAPVEGKLIWSFPGLSFPARPMLKDLNPPEYDPSKQTSKNYDAELEDYRISVNKHFREAGYTRAEDKVSLEHFKWLGLRQVKGYSAEALVNALKLDPRSVRQALNDTARLVGINLHPLPAGRPKERKTGSENAEDITKTPEIRRLIADRQPPV